MAFALPEGCPGAVMLASYPRSGNTWIRYLLSYLFSDQDRIHREDLNQYVPDLHEIGWDHVLAVQARVLKTHDYPHNSYRHAIYVIRDPRDVAISYYNRMKNREEIDLSRPDFIRNWTEDRIWPGSWASHALSWREYIQKTGGLFLRYERLKQDTPKTLERISQYIGLGASSEDIETAHRRASFDNYKSDAGDHEKLAIKGKAGGWQEELSQEEIAIIEQAHGKTMELVGYKLSARHV